MLHKAERVEQVNVAEMAEMAERAERAERANVAEQCCIAGRAGPMRVSEARFAGAAC